MVRSSPHMYPWLDQVSRILHGTECIAEANSTISRKSIHKGAFLRDMRNGDRKYCSKLLVYCIFARAVAVSNQPALRALTLADDSEDDLPYLVKKGVQLLETALDNPGITTAQSLQLPSEMHYAISHDTKGWMYAGMNAL
jgi:hypothetical protein